MKTPLPQSIPSLLGGVIPARHVRIAPAKVETLTSCAVAATHDASRPKITMIRDGDTVRAIRVECSCGEVIQLDCQY
ncbi:MAG: hypothetical protein WCL32_14705 [Planctomycetota bacterium]|jgi:hypothetical protein